VKRLLLLIQALGIWLREALRLLRWFVRKWFWIFIAWFKAVMNRPLDIPLPPDALSAITPVPLAQAIASIPAHLVRVCPPDQIPADERSTSKTLFYRLQVWLYRVFPPMQACLPSISSNPDRALRNAYPWLLRTKYPAPVLPAEYLASPDLGGLAVRGPYACYTRKATDGGFEWDLMSLADHEHHPGLLQLGVKVRFEVMAARRALRAVRIDSALGTSQPGDRGWELAKKLALCSATTHLSLVRHFNWVHLATAAPLAIAARNRLAGRHPLMRLLWPYLYATEQSNDTVTRGQMVPGGDFDTTFSFTHKGLCSLFDASWDASDFGINDPPQDALKRQVTGQGFDTPTEDNLAALFQLMHEHSLQYLSLYYPHAARGAGSEGLGGDAALLAFLGEANQLLPGGVGVTRNDITLQGLARLAARCIYLASAQHELAGSFVWNYQLWTHRQPVRVYANDRPEPLDVHQRLVNANFNLNVSRRMLIGDFSYLALDPQGAAAMRRFQLELQRLQAEMVREPWAVWKLYPDVLKVNINA
jgi:arachidonate 15-lipoxygenase